MNRVLPVLMALLPIALVAVVGVLVGPIILDALGISGPLAVVIVVVASLVPAVVVPLVLRRRRRRAQDVDRRP